MSIFKKVFLLTLIVCTGKFSFAQFTTTTGNITQQSAGSIAIGYPAYIPTSQTFLQVKNGSVLFDGTTGITPTSGAGTRLMWVPAKKAFRAGSVATTQWDDISIGANSFACGENTIASGAKSFACGTGTSASGLHSFTCGSGTSATQLFAFASGVNSTASGVCSFSSGSGTIASGQYSNSFGATTIASGLISTSFGNSTVAQSSYSFVLGRYNLNPGTYSLTTWVATDPLFVIGNGTSATSRNNALTVLKNGNVLIDKVTQLNSTYKLDVNGKIRALEIVVNTTGADFVFEKEYELMPLDVLEQKIKSEKHLPEIASAKEMQTNGVGLSELNTKLLQKTEELTLYIIELNKRIEMLEKKGK